MKGLLIKDLICLKGTIKIYIAMILVFMVLGLVIASGDGGEEGIWTVLGMISILAAILPFTSAILDEQAHWDKRALTLPLRRSTVVYSKYLLGGILILGAAVANLCIGLAAGTELRELLPGIWALVLFSLLMLSLIIPLLLRFGAEKGRFLMIFIAALLSGLFVTVGSRIGIPGISQASLMRMLLLGSLAVAAIVLISVSISLRVYEKKEF